MSYAPFPLVWGAFGGGGPASPSFGIIQTDFGTYPTATGASDILTIVSADSGKYFFTGTALTDTVTLTITGFVSHDEFEEYGETIKEPTGFPNRTDSITSFSNATRIFSISPTGASFDVYIRGHKYTKTTTQSVVIPNQDGDHYIYFDIDGELQTTQVLNSDLFQNNAFVSIIYWNTETQTQIYYAEERHGLVMDGATHSYLHTVFGARYLSGFALQNFSVDGSGDIAANAQFTSDSGSFRDEDLLIQAVAQAQIPILYRQGTLWRKKAADLYPVIYSGTAGYTGASGLLAYNRLNGGTWSLSEVPNNSFVLVHIFATNDINNPVVGIQGINTYISVSAARTGATTEISSLAGLPFAEFLAIGSVIFETANSYSNVPKARVRSTDLGGNYVDFRGTQPYTPAYGSATSHSLLSNLSSDDHLQYLTEARGDARYYTQGQTDTLLDGFDTRITEAENDASEALAIANDLEPRVESLESDVNDIEVNYRYTLRKQKFTLTSGDISIGYIDLSYVAASESLHGYVDRLPIFDGDDFTTQVITNMFGSFTRITFAGALLPSGSTPLQVGDIVHFLYAQKVQVV
jgi:hypothetical protein